VGQARLLIRGTPGQVVELIDWTDFVKYLDELREGRSLLRRVSKVIDSAGLG
jgi:type IV secretion system protein VirD4